MRRQDLRSLTFIIMPSKGFEVTCLVCKTRISKKEKAYTTQR